MPTGSDLERSCARFLGEPYSTAGGRTSQTSGYKDCSGLVYAGLRGIGIDPGGNTVSTSLETWAVRNGGRYVSPEFAQNNPGCGLAIWGTGAQGHIGISASGGRSLETPSQFCHCVGYSRFLGRNGHWTGYFTFPGISYGGEVITPPKPKAKGDDDVMFSVAGQGGDYWIHSGARVTDANAFSYVAKGGVAVRVNELELERGLAGENPGTGQVDRPLAPRICESLRTGSAAANAAAANLRAENIQNRVEEWGTYLADLIAQVQAKLP